MNDLEIEINSITDIVIECCVTHLQNGDASITKSEVLSKSKKENATIARYMLSNYLLKFGLSTTTISLMFNCSVQSVRNMLSHHEDWMKNSQAYRIANAQVSEKLFARNKQVIQ